MTLESSDTRPVDVLLVEDNPADVELTQRILRDSEHPLHITVAEDGEVAMNILRKVGVHSDAPRPDLILLDLNMPRKNGYEVLQEMSQSPDLNLIPVLILTSTQAERDRLQFVNVSPSRYCTKPLPISRFNTIMGRLRSEEYVAWAELASHDDQEREPVMLETFSEIARLAERQRSDRMAPLVRADYDMQDDRLRAMTVSRLRVLLRMDRQAAGVIAASYNAAVQQLPAEQAMRQAAMAQRLRIDFSEEEQERLLVIDPGLFGAKIEPPRVPRPVAEPAGQSAGGRRWWWPFGR